MSIELRILSGARAGQSQLFEEAAGAAGAPITVGRHPSCDLRFDATLDLDVSAQHGEIRRDANGHYTVVDDDSTNGTFVNGERLERGGSRVLRDGDVITFGAHGPAVAVRIAAARTTQAGARPTTERVAIAVAQQTRGLKLAVGAAIVVLGGLAFGAYWSGHREAAAADARLQSLVAAFDQSSAQLQSRVATTNDTTLIRDLERQKDSLVRLARAARVGASGTDAAVVQQSLERHQTAAKAIGAMDLSAVRAANNAAVALIRTDFAGAGGYEATGFGVTPTGGVITNRHVVVDSAGGHPTRILVKFANTDEWKHAHLARLPESADVDLALVQIDDAGTYPVVSGVASSVDVSEGAPILSLGFPLGTDIPMDGPAATTTLTVGTVSKSIPSLLQIDSYASHGSSGSPVFDAHGHVIGVVYGGPREAEGRIVFAVPAAEVGALVRR